MPVPVPLPLKGLLIRAVGIDEVGAVLVNDIHHTERPLRGITIWRSRDASRENSRPAADSTANTPLPSRLCIRADQCR